jgi:HAD superfamily hydrolase (TIGR01484 family)
VRYHALVCDYDGTLAHDGVLDAPTRAALRRLKDSDRYLLMVTGRELPDLKRACPHLDMFDYVVAENGALLYRPATKEERPLAEPPPAAFVDKLKAAGVAPLSVGRVIVATWEPHETAVLQVIRDLGLERQVIFNKGAVMILPAGITKATGLTEALREMQLSPHNAVAVGDAENDHHMLALCECGVAVANALPSLKARADWVTSTDHGAGVAELAEKLLATDLAELGPTLTRRLIPLGRIGDSDWLIQPYGTNLLLAGTSGSGKSTFATGFLERLSDRGYQYCVIDPEGDYENLGPVVFGRPDQAPAVDQVLRLLEDPEENAVINLLGIALADRPAFFQNLFTALLGLRARTGRPHWIVIDEMHHMLPAANGVTNVLLAPGLSGILGITVHPDHVARSAIKLMDIAVAIGATPKDTLERFAHAVGQAPPAVPERALPPEQAIGWHWRRQEPPKRFERIAPRTERRRHHRKYAIGELPPDLSFYFRGPQGKLNLRAQNLLLFMQSADGVDDDTWQFHLQRGDYSRWFEEVIKDDDLAQAAREIERMPKEPPRRTRQLVRQQIEKRYSAPA